MKPLRTCYALDSEFYCQQWAGEDRYCHISEADGVVYYEDVAGMSSQEFKGWEDSLLDQEGVSLVSATRPGLKHRPSYRLKTRNGYASVKPISAAFGFDVDPSKNHNGMTYADCVEAFRSAFYDAYGVDAATRGSAAAHVLKVALGEEWSATHYPKKKPLCRELWGMSLDAVIQGPMTLIARQADHAIMVDQKGAYHNALNEVRLPSFQSTPFPCYGNTMPTMEELEDGCFDGFIDALWYFPGGHVLPPCCHKSTGESLWATGELHLRMNSRFCHMVAAYGGRILKIYNAFRYSSDSMDNPHLKFVYRELYRFPKWIRKEIYCVLWGLLASKGGFTYYPSNWDKVEWSPEGRIVKNDTITFFNDSGLPWSRHNVEDFENAPITFRPDIASFIASGPAIKTIDVANRYGNRSLATHIDSVYIESVPGEVIDIDGWSEKARGAFRGYGVGNLTCGGHRATMGYRGNMDLSDWYAGIRDNTRMWEGNRSLPWHRYANGMWG